MPRLICMYKTPKGGQGSQLCDCHQGSLKKKKSWKPGKPQLSRPQKNSFPRRNTLLTAKQALHLYSLHLTPAALQGGSGRRWRRGADMSFWLMLQRMTGVLWVHALSYTAWFHLLCITISVCSQEDAGVVQSCLPSGYPVWFQPTWYPWGLLPSVWRAGKGEFCALVSAWAQIPFLAEGHFWTRHMTKWIQEPAGHFCYLSKHDLCQIQHQKPLRSILLTDVSTHKDNLSLFLI